MAQAQVQAPDLPKVVKAAETELQYKGSTVTVHAKGCGHRRFAAHVSPFNVAEAVLFTDDWYDVAPCAKKANA